MGANIVLARQGAGKVWALASHPFMRGVPALLIGGWFLWALMGRLQGFDLGLLARGIADIAVWQWLLAGCASAVSLLAVSGYDLPVSRGFALHLTPVDAMRSGFVATALAQLVGFGLVTGAVMRWRMLAPGRISLARTTLLTMAVTTAFLAAAGWLTAVAALVWMDLSSGVTAVATAVMLAGIAFTAFCLWRPRFRLAGRSLGAPKILAIWRVTTLAVLDLGFAALALWLLLPASAGIEFGPFLPVFLIATIAGLLSGMPGGVGPFELTCFALLPALQSESCLTAILAFRVIYYLLPGAIAAGLLAATEMLDRRASHAKDGRAGLVCRPLPHRFLKLTDTAPRAEAKLVHDGEFDMLTYRDGQAASLVAARGNALIQFSDPLGDANAHPDLIATLIGEAAQQNRIPVIYKCSADIAACAASLGFTRFQIGAEAVLCPQDFTLDGPKKRSLRRKLRLAEKSGISIALVENARLPLADMARVSSEWATQRGGERRFSMGRFQPAEHQYHRFFLAYDRSRLVGFIGLLTTQGETALDLIRLSPDAPDGVAHALVVAAITDAAKRPQRRFSLASVPFLTLSPPRNLIERMCHWGFSAFADKHGAKGLHQFKQGFDPRWEGRYLACPNTAKAMIAALDILRAIQPNHPRRKQLADRQTHSTSFFPKIEADQFQIPASLPDIGRLSQSEGGKC